MLGIVIAAGALLAAGSTYQRIRQQEKRIKKQIELAKQRARIKQKALRLKEEQVKDTASQEKIGRQLEALKEQATLRASFGEAGVLGNTPLRELYNVKFEEERDTGVTNKKLRNNLAQVDDEKEATRAEKENAIKAAKSQKMSGWAKAFTIGSAALQGGLSAYGGYSAMQGAGLFGAGGQGAGVGGKGQLIGDFGFAIG